MRRACERAVDARAAGDRLHRAPGLHRLAATTTGRPTEGLLDRHPAHQLPIDVEGYFAELTEVRERFPELRIWSGVETGEPHLFAASVAAHLRDSPVDRVLGSLHSLDLDGRLVGVGRLLLLPTPTRTMRRYLGEIVRDDREQRRLPGAGARRLPAPLLAGRARTGTWRRPTRRSTGRSSGRWPRTGRALEVNTTQPAGLGRTRCAGSTRRAARRSASAATPTSPTAVGQQFDLAVDVVEAAGFRPGRDRFDFWRR